jgi:Lactate dehydrogenase and related dehydrogenases
MNNSVLITFAAPKNVIRRAQEMFITHVSAKELSAEETLDEAVKFQPSSLIVTPRQKMTAEIINKLPSSVKIIATSSVGFDHLDIPAAKARGIALTNTPDVLTECTADLAMLLLLNACRRGREYLEIMENGWGKSFSQSEMLGVKVSGKTLGIYGMGRIGQAIADRARAFGMKIIYCNRKRLSPELEKGATYFADFKEMLPHCQILSLNAPGTAETQHIMNDETFALMPKHSVLVNVARGSLVDEKALMKAIESEHLFAAGLDVFEQEPDFNQELLKFKQIYLTPHMGSATEETRDEMGYRALKNIDLVLDGQIPMDPLY